MFGSKKKSNKGRREIDRDSKIILHSTSPWPVQEAYKALRTNILFSLPGKGAKVIGVTSAFRGDGKSINSVNSAIAFGQLGKKVCLIDCDMRLPTVAAKIGIQGKPGLSDFLSGQTSINQVLVAVKKYGIHVIPAGNIPPDPTRLLQSRQMKDLLTALRNVYDYIIIDLPPVTTVTDAVILSEYIDGYLLVVRHAATEYGAINDMLAQLKMAEANIIGFVYNDAEQEGSKYYHGKYYRNYYKSYYKK